MKILFAAAGLVVASMAVATLAQEEKEAGKKPQVNEVVVPMEGVHEFVVTGRSTLFRLPVSTIAGGEISDPKITGKAKHLRTERIVTVREKGEPLVGPTNMEFVFRGTAAGTVTIEFTKTLPTQPNPEVEKFTVTIK
jgi:hypothetical protein